MRKMSSNVNSSINITKRERTYTLSCICNFSGRKNNKLVTCALCAKKVHISIRCPAPYTSDNSGSDDTTERQCLACIKSNTASMGTRVSMLVDSCRPFGIFYTIWFAPLYSYSNASGNISIVRCAEEWERYFSLYNNTKQTWQMYRYISYQPCSGVQSDKANSK